MSDPALLTSSPQVEASNTSGEHVPPSSADDAATWVPVAIQLPDRLRWWRQHRLREHPIPEGHYVLNREYFNYTTFGTRPLSQHLLKDLRNARQALAHHYQTARLPATVVEPLESSQTPAQPPSVRAEEGESGHSAAATEYPSSSAVLAAAPHHNDGGVEENKQSAGLVPPPAGSARYGVMPTAAPAAMASAPHLTEYREHTDDATGTDGDWDSEEGEHRTGCDGDAQCTGDGCRGRASRPPTRALTESEKVALERFVQLFRARSASAPVRPSYHRDCRQPDGRRGPPGPSALLPRRSVDVVEVTGGPRSRGDHRAAGLSDRSEASPRALVLHNPPRVVLHTKRTPTDAMLRAARIHRDDRQQNARLLDRPEVLDLSLFPLLPCERYFYTEQLRTVAVCSGEDTQTQDVRGLHTVAAGADTEPSRTVANGAEARAWDVASSGCGSAHTVSATPSPLPPRGPTISSGAISGSRSRRRRAASLPPLPLLWSSSLLAPRGDRDGQRPSSPTLRRRRMRADDAWTTPTPTLALPIQTAHCALTAPTPAGQCQENSANHLCRRLADLQDAYIFNPLVDCVGQGAFSQVYAAVPFFPCTALTLSPTGAIARTGTPESASSPSQTARSVRSDVQDNSLHTPAAEVAGHQVPVVALKIIARKGKQRDEQRQRLHTASAVTMAQTGLPPTRRQTAEGEDGEEDWRASDGRPHADSSQRRELVEIEREISVLRQLKHTGCSLFYEALRTPDAFVIAMKLNKGSMDGRQFLSRFGLPSEARAALLIYQLVATIHYLHNVFGVLHRDIKLENVLVSVIESVPVERVREVLGTQIYKADHERKHDDPSRRRADSTAAPSTIAAAARSRGFSTIDTAALSLRATLIDFGLARRIHSTTSHRQMSMTVSTGMSRGATTHTAGVGQNSSLASGAVRRGMPTPLPSTANMLTGFWEVEDESGASSTDVSASETEEDEDDVDADKLAGRDDRGVADWVTRAEEDLSQGPIASTGAVPSAPRQQPHPTRSSCATPVCAHIHPRCPSVTSLPNKAFLTAALPVHTISPSSTPTKATTHTHRQHDMSHGGDSAHLEAPPGFTVHRSASIPFMPSPDVPTVDTAASARSPSVTSLSTAVRAPTAAAGRSGSACYGAATLPSPLSPHSTNVAEDGAPILLTPCGTEKYMAPEMLEWIVQHGWARRPTSVGLAKQMDMYAVGVLAYVFLSGCFPFNGTTRATLAQQQKRVPRCTSEHWRGVSGNAISFVKGLLEPDPERRLTAEQALKHPFLREAAYWAMKLDLVPGPVDATSRTGTRTTTDRNGESGLPTPTCARDGDSPASGGPLWSVDASLLCDASPSARQVQALATTAKRTRDSLTDVDALVDQLLRDSCESSPTRAHWPLSKSVSACTPPATAAVEAPAASCEGAAHTCDDHDAHIHRSSAERRAPEAEASLSPTLAVRTAVALRSFTEEAVTPTPTVMSYSTDTATSENRYTHTKAPASTMTATKPSNAGSTSLSAADVARNKNAGADTNDLFDELYHNIMSCD